MVIQTAYGVLVRTAPGASPLPVDAQGGQPAEEATHNAAALWGLPDFLYRATVLQKGSGSREVGDRILVVGKLGVVVQVKRREAVTDDETKERRWVEKNAQLALKQAHGTIRTLRSGPLRLTNGRGRAIEVDGNELRWLTVAVIDHPDAPPGVVPNSEDGPNPAVVLLRRDWEFLFRQLKSNHAVSQYFERVADQSWELGAEPARYFRLANADAHAEPHSIDADALGSTGRVVGGPLLPIEPAGSGDDELPHLFLRSLIEDIATSRLEGLKEEDRLHMLGELDRLAVAQRVGIGRFLLDAMELTAKEPPGEVVWRQRQFFGPHDSQRPLHLGYATCSHEWDDRLRGMFTTWVWLRHHQLWENLGQPEDLTTVGLVVTPRSDGIRPWDTSVVAAIGDLGLEAPDTAH
jgi:hypothetical protein